MSRAKENRILIGTGIFSAVAASLCCITPLFALIAGSSGMASTFSWLAPARPFFTGVTFLVLGMAWYQKLRFVKKQSDGCGCEIKKTSFLQTKLFLGIITVFSILMLSFPYYSHIFYPQKENRTIMVDKANIETVEFKISGMTCESCEDHIKNEVSKLDGVIRADVSYSNANASIEFDKTKISVGDIQKSIHLTGYQVTSSNLK